MPKPGPRNLITDIAGLRVGVKNGGCAGMAYTVEYANEVKPSDEVVEDKGVKILVDPKAVLFLLGALRVSPSGGAGRGFAVGLVIGGGAALLGLAWTALRAGRQGPARR